ncbi:MAG: SRPBCC family protein [Deltaproteobacteria bacterium]|nr:SRPBCC family protein [Deltaproteobacteria bacterium]
MKTIEKSIDVNVPVRTAYNQWTQFEEFPRFLEGVEEVRQLDDTLLHWRANIGGKSLEWNARIIEQVPDNRIAWQSEGGPMHNGMVSFHPIGAESARVTLRMDYEPEGLLQETGDKLGFVSRQVEEDLERFKQFIESRGVETGAWRGAV